MRNADLNDVADQNYKEAVEYERKELEQLLAKRDAIRAKQMKRYDDRSATRARTTTSNAEASRLNDRIEWLRSEIKKMQL